MTPGDYRCMSVLSLWYTWLYTPLRCVRMKEFTGCREGQESAVALKTWHERSTADTYSMLLFGGSEQSLSLSKCLNYTNKRLSLSKPIAEIFTLPRHKRQLNISWCLQVSHPKYFFSFPNPRLNRTLRIGPRPGCISMKIKIKGKLHPDTHELCLYLNICQFWC